MKFISYALATALSISTTLPADAAEVVTEADVTLKVDLGCKKIVQLAVEDTELSTLVAALTAADLVGALSGEGPFTVFAPRNKAFDALPEGTLDTLLMPENKGQLTNILGYHVVSGKVMSGDLEDGDVPTINGATVAVDLTDGVMINDANVVTPDIEACNGVIHKIDAVLIPPPKEPETSSPTDTLNSKSGKSTAKASKASSTSAKAGKSDADKTETSSPTDTLISKSSKSTVAKASKAGSTSAKAGKSDTDKMKTSPSAKAVKSDTDKMKTSPSAKAVKSDTDKMKTTPSAKTAKASTRTPTTIPSAKADKGASSPSKKSTKTDTTKKTSTTVMSADEPDEPEPEDKTPKPEDEPDEKEEDEELSYWEAFYAIADILIGDGKRKLSSHLRG